MDASVSTQPLLEAQQLSSLQQIATTLRCLSIEAIEKARSGHPGLPLGCAEIAAYLFGYKMRYYSKDPHWLARDRFILSAGHGSMLLYASLHLAGFSLSLEDLKSFRQLHSKTPGHPEFSLKEGVETTSGPLGQGVAHAVGQALGIKLLAQRCSLIHSKVYVLASDGDLMEGVSAEASSLAGHWSLDNLVVIYDANNICLDGSTDECFTEDVAKRYEAYGWEVLSVKGNDLQDLHRAFSHVESQTKPVLLVANTVIGKGSPNKANSHKVHGSPLGEQELLETKKALGASLEPFFVPESVRESFHAHREKQQHFYQEWHQAYASFQQSQTSASQSLQQLFQDPSLERIAKTIATVSFKQKEAGRDSSQRVLNALAKELPQLIGGSADLSCSDKSYLKEYNLVSSGDFSGRNLKYGVREFAMAALSAGLAQTGAFIPYCATFLVFSDYMRNALRLSALMKLKVLYLFTHDSIFLGEDGPTHQPVEHYASLRAIPDLQFIRPADAKEVAHAYFAALSYQGPTAIALSRQALPLLETGDRPYEKTMAQGAYIVKKEKESQAFLTLIATGSEVHLAIEVAKDLEKQGRATRVLSMPCWELFEKQTADTQKKLLGEGKKYSLEAGVSMGWHRWTEGGKHFGIETFGLSAPGVEVAEAFSLSKGAIVNEILRR